MGDVAHTNDLLTVKPGTIVVPEGPNVGGYGKERGPLRQPDNEEVRASSHSTGQPEGN